MAAQRAAGEVLVAFRAVCKKPRSTDILMQENIADFKTVFCASVYLCCGVFVSHLLPVICRGKNGEILCWKNAARFFSTGIFFF